MAQVNRVHFDENAKNFDGTSEYNELFHKIIYEFLSKKISLDNIRIMISDLLVLQHLNELLEDLLYRISNKLVRVPVLPLGGCDTIMLSTEHISNCLNISKLFQEMLTEAYNEAFSSETYFSYVESDADATSLDFNPETVFPE